jgi:predicted phosphoribosyltransferase
MLEVLHFASATIARTPSLSVVIPAFNERERLPKPLAASLLYLRTQARDWEVIVVDDGIATGMTAKAALVSLGKVDAASLSLAIPVIDSSVAQELVPLLDRLEALAYVANLSCVGLWYQHFPQLSDSEVLEYLKSAATANPSPAFLRHSSGLPAV